MCMSVGAGVQMLECTGGTGQTAMTHGSQPIRLQMLMTLTSQLEVSFLLYLRSISLF